jgi:small subunit ribosomal protein S12e
VSHTLRFHSLTVCYSFLSGPGAVGAYALFPTQDTDLYFLGLVKGLNQVGKALDRKDAYLCILATDCDDPKYKKLITALAKQNKIPLVEVDSRNLLGEWTGQAKYDKTGEARKVRGCSSLAIKDYGEHSEALTFLEEHIKSNGL